MKRIVIFPPFTSRLTVPETILCLLALPMHIWILPRLLTSFVLSGQLTESTGNFLVYSIGAVYMMIVLGRFFRRDYDMLCDRFLFCLHEVIVGYGFYFCCNMIIGPLLYSLVGDPAGNPNTAAVAGLAQINRGQITAMAVILAPILEEGIFRAGIFGFFHRYNRAAAYVASMLIFAVYHVWSFAVQDPKYWLYLIQYLPISYMICRGYERSSSIWTPVMLHALVNGISLSVLA